MMPDLSAKDRREARKWLIRMMDRPDIHREGLQAWLEGRPDRRAFYLSLHRKMGRATAGAELTGMQVGQHPVGTARQSRPARGLWGPVAASGLAFIVLLAAGLCFLPTPGNRINPVLLTTRVGEVRPERLEDGTIVTLDTATAIDVKIAPGTRTVVLRHGRARFVVSPTAADKPLTVIDGENSVVASAATFDVGNAVDRTALVVAGSAEVRLKPAVFVVDGSRSIRLAAGQKLIFNSGQEAQPSAIAARPSDAQWIGGVKSFSEVPINEVIAEANTYSDTKIVLVYPSMGTRRITAQLHIRDVEAVAAAVSGFLKLDIDRTQPGKLILTSGN